MHNEVNVSIGKQGFTTEVQIANHTIIADEPLEVNGQDLGPAPLTLLLASLGSCKAMTMRMYADQKHWPLDRVELKLSAEVVKSDLQQTTYVRCSIKIFGDLDEAQRDRIYKIADRCPIQRILNNPIVIESNMLQ